MESIRLEPQLEAEPLDAATQAALDEAEAQLARGEVYTLDEVRASIQERAEAWRKAHDIALPA